jgi:hypothetical protein
MYNEQAVSPDVEYDSSNRKKRWKISLSVSFRYRGDKLEFKLCEKMRESWFYTLLCVR